MGRRDWPPAWGASPLLRGRSIQFRRHAPASDRRLLASLRATRCAAWRIASSAVSIFTYTSPTCDGLRDAALMPGGSACRWYRPYQATARRRSRTERERRDGTGRRAPAPHLKRQDRLHHRHPAGHARGIRREGPAIGSPVHLEQLRVEPEPLGLDEVPFRPDAVLVESPNSPAPTSRGHTASTSSARRNTPPDLGATVER